MAPSSKPQAAAETARVLRIFDWLAEEMAGNRRLAMLPSPPPPIFGRETVIHTGYVGDILIVAERIAARTEG